FHQIARFVADYEIIPGVRFEIFDRKRHPPVFGIDASDDRFDLLAFLQNLSGMLDPPRPRNVGNVDESIDAVLDFDKGAEVSQVSDASLNSRTNLITVTQSLPRVFLDLFHAEADAARFRIDAEHLNFYRVARINKLARMLDAFGPAHFGDMDQTFDTGFKLDERAISGHARDFSSHSRARRKALFDRLPLIG